MGSRHSVKNYILPKHSTDLLKFLLKLQNIFKRNRKIVPKFMWNHRTALIGNINLTKKKSTNLKVSHSLFKDTVIKTVLCYHKSSYIDQ